MATILRPPVFSPSPKPSQVAIQAQALGSLNLTLLPPPVVVVVGDTSLSAASLM